MGAVFNSRMLDGSLTKQQVKERFEDIQDQDRYENGHSYSGGFGMAAGLEFHTMPVFPDVNAAIKWLDDNAQKWEAALCIRAKRDDTEVWVIGATCSS